VGQDTEATGPARRHAKVIPLVAQLHLAGVQRDSEPKGSQRCDLHIERTRHRVRRSSERHDKAVAFALLHRPNATVSGHQAVQRAVERLDGGGHRVRIGFPKMRRAFDIGE
jgi:hypothetical protein